MKPIVEGNISIGGGTNKEGKDQQLQQVHSILNKPKDNCNNETCSNEVRSFQSSLKVGSEDTRRLKNLHLSSNNSSEGSELTERVTSSVSDVPDSTNIELSLDCRKKSIISDLLSGRISEAAPDSTISRSTIKSDSKEIGENRSSKLTLVSNGSNQTNGYQTGCDNILDSITVHDSSSENESDENNGDLSQIKSSKKYQMFICQECTYTSKCMFILKYHRCKKGAIDGIYPCYICHTPFKDEDEFCSHLQAYHTGMVNKHEPSLACWTMTHLKLLNMESNYCTCTFCPAVFPFQELVQAHIKFVHH